MANNLFNMLGQKTNPMSNLMSQLNELRTNPVQFLAQRKFNLPQNFQGGPQEIVQHLLNTGQMTQEQFNQLQSKVSSMNFNQ